MRLFLLSIAIICFSVSGFSQSEPDEEMNMEFLTTYGRMLKSDCVEDDFSKTIFFMIPEQYNKSFYIRVFDPDCGGLNDHSNGLWETNTIFKIFGGEGCMRKRIMSEVNLKLNSKTGTLLSSELFGDESLIDNSWYTFGPFKPEQGETIDACSGRFFKIVVEGRTGDDGNSYALFLSDSDEENLAINGASLFQDIDKIVLQESATPKPAAKEFSISAEPIDE